MRRGRAVRHHCSITLGRQGASPDPDAVTLGRQGARPDPDAVDPDAVTPMPLAQGIWPRSATGVLPSQMSS